MHRNQTEDEVQIEAKHLKEFLFDRGWPSDGLLPSADVVSARTFMPIYTPSALKLFDELVDAVLNDDFMNTKK